MSLYSSLSKSIVRRVLVTLIAALLCALCSLVETPAQQRRRVPITNRSAIVVDERLAVLRDGPELSARLLQRMSRGRVVLILGAKRSSDGLTFYRVAVTRRTSGWLQSEAVVSPGRSDDERLLRLIRSSEDFDRVVRARIFLDLFPRSPARPQVLLIYGEAAEAAATRLSRDASRRLDEREMAANGAPPFSYYLSYSGLDRYRRQGITFTFNRASKQFHYDGESWREILRRYPRSPEALEARKRLDALAGIAVK
jgi:hypothetical protein